MTYTPTRPLMTADELSEHQIDSHGRDYRLSDDGVGDAEVNRARGWKALTGWGKAGWDLGDWPYLVLFIRDRGDKFQLLSVCEGDHEYYSFDTLADRDAALDYLFLWYAAGKHDWAPITWEQREALDKGEITVDDRFRGPYRES